MNEAHPQLAALLKQLADAFGDAPFNKMLGCEIKKIDPHEVIVTFDMKKELIGNYLHGILHGGVISSVLDTAGGIVVMAAQLAHYKEANAANLAQLLGKCSTVDLTINYLSPGRGEHFIAKATLLKRGNKICFARMELFNQTETLIATGNGTYLF